MGHSGIFAAVSDVMSFFSLLEARKKLLLEVEALKPWQVCKAYRIMTELEAQNEQFRRLYDRFEGAVRWFATTLYKFLTFFLIGIACFAFWELQGYKLALWLCMILAAYYNVVKQFGIYQERVLHRRDRR